MYEKGYINQILFIYQKKKKKKKKKKYILKNLVFKENIKGSHQNVASQLINFESNKYCSNIISESTYLQVGVPTVTFTFTKPGYNKN
ncbi:hypothetical protein RB653_009092 [Dictyostelium firmibasis]|uniref:Uncharacterized protein n=1 Tax=Dictyostelium firmibasis TaxID=79012 RepID=A0AAN7YPU3_9MYCE